MRRLPAGAVHEPIRKRDSRQRKVYGIVVAYRQDLDPLRAHDAMTLLAFGHSVVWDALAGCDVEG